MKFKEADRKNLDPETTKAIEKANKEDKGLFIYGNTGTGKSYTLHAIAKDKGFVHNFIELLLEFRNSLNKGYYKDNVEALCEKKFLFIDDIGSETTSDYVLEFLYLVINKRYESMKRIALTTNLSLEEFEQRYGARILSRIAEMCIVHEIKGEDKRLSN